MEGALRPVGLIAVAGLVVMAYALWPGTFPMDDAYITLHNARVVISGADDPLYGGSPLIGATSAVHLVLVALLGLLLPLAVASFTVSMAGTLLYAAGLVHLGKVGGVSGWQRHALVAIGLLSSYVPVHLVNGLETSLAMAAVVWGLAWADDRRLPLLCGTMPFIRPELAFLAALLMIRLLVLSRHDRAEGVRLVLMAGVAALPWALWYWLATGLPFPNTAGAKIVFFGQDHLPLDERLKFWTGAIVVSLLLPLLPSAVGLARVRAGWCAAAFAILWLLVAILTFPASLRFNDARYLAVLVPVLVYGLAGLCASSRSARWYLIPLLLFSAYTGASGLIRLRDCLVGVAQGWEPPARFVRDELPRGSVVLVHDAGWIAWAEPKVRLVDVVGLKTPSSAQVHARFAAPQCGWGPALSQIALATRATHAVVLEQPIWECIGENLRMEGWQLAPVYRQLGGFTVYRIKPPLMFRR